MCFKCTHYTRIASSAPSFKEIVKNKQKSPFTHLHVVPNSNYFLSLWNKKGEWLVFSMPLQQISIEAFEPWKRTTKYYICYISGLLKPMTALSEKQTEI